MKAGEERDDEGVIGADVKDVVVVGAACETAAV